MDPTIELTEQDERDWQAERQEEIASICWQKCSDCNGQGHHVWYWEDEGGGPDHLLRPTCRTCRGKSHIQLHDPQCVEALFAAADDARERMGVWCYTRIAKALALAIDGAVRMEADESGSATVASQMTADKIYSVLLIIGCDCYDAHSRAPKIAGIPHCKHWIAVWLVKAAEKKKNG